MFHRTYNKQETDNDGSFHQSHGLIKLL